MSLKLCCHNEKSMLSKDAMYRPFCQVPGTCLQQSFALETKRTSGCSRRPHLCCDLLKVHVRVVENPLKGLRPVLLFLGLPVLVPAHKPALSETPFACATVQCSAAAQSIHSMCAQCHGKKEDGKPLKAAGLSGGWGMDSQGVGHSASSQAQHKRGADRHAHNGACPLPPPGSLGRPAAL